MDSDHHTKCWKAFTSTQSLMQWVWVNPFFICFFYFSKEVRSRCLCISFFQKSGNYSTPLKPLAEINQSGDYGTSRPLKPKKSTTEPQLTGQTLSAAEF